MKTHELKTWPVYFQAIADGRKTFELRKNDRDYQEGDTLILREYFIDTQKYSGRSISRKVGYILHEGFGLPEGTCIMSLVEEDPDDEADSAEAAEAYRAWKAGELEAVPWEEAKKRLSQKRPVVAKWMYTATGWQWVYPEGSEPALDEEGA